jgi:arsenate reductase
MKEAGVDSAEQESTRLTSAMLDWADLVVTLCGHADGSCPLLPADTRKIHWPLSAPARADGSEEDTMTVFHASRDDIRDRVRARISESPNQLCATGIGS